MNKPPWDSDERTYGEKIVKIKIPDEFTERENIKSAVLVLVNVGVVLFAGLIAYWVNHFAVYVLAFVLVGARAQALYILQHECMHYLLFDNRKVNNVVGLILSALLGTRLSMGRRFHFKHHRQIGTPDDPNEIWHNVERIPPGRRALGHFVFQLLGGRLLLMVKGLVASLVGMRKPPTTSSQTQPTKTPAKANREDLVEILLLFGVQGLIFGTMCVFAHPGVYFFLYFLPLATLTAFFEAIRSFSEHVLPTRPVVPAESYRLFYMRSNGLERFFISQFYFNYHHLHHMYPNVVTFKLAKLHRWLLVHDPLYFEKFVERSGYLSVAWTYVLGTESLADSRDMSYQEAVWNSSKSIRQDHGVATTQSSTSLAAKEGRHSSKWAAERETSR